MTTKTTDLASLAETARQAQEALDAAEADQSAAQAQARAERTARRAAFEQEFLDTYDPAALRVAVGDTFGAIVEAVESGNVPAALRAHLLAVMREVDDASRARDAVGNGAVPRPEILWHHPRTGTQLRGADGLKDYNGRDIVSTNGDALTDYVGRALHAAIAEAARRARVASQAALDTERAAFVDGGTS